MNDTDARLWHPWLRINRVLRAMLHTRWSAEAWAEIRVEFRKALALRSQIRRAGGLTSDRGQTGPEASERFPDRGEERLPIPLLVPTS
jgi:hypothetical protein